MAKDWLDEFSGRRDGLFAEKRTVHDCGDGVDDAVFVHRRPGHEFLHFGMIVGFDAVAPVAFDQFPANGSLVGRSMTGCCEAATPTKGSGSAVGGGLGM